MTAGDLDALVQLDLNNPKFQVELFDLQKAERHSALETFKKLRRMTWPQVYADSGLKWEKIVSVSPPAGVAAIYSLRLSQSRRAIAFREGVLMRFLSVSPDHDTTYGRK